jgi:hypothetical protein
MLSWILGIKVTIEDIQGRNGVTHGSSFKLISYRKLCHLCLEWLFLYKLHVLAFGGLGRLEMMSHQSIQSIYKHYLTVVHHIIRN